MNCLPVIEMELRSASRRTWTFSLRLAFALTGAATCLVILILPHSSAPQKGQTMLILLSSLGLLFCLAAGGFLTADSISSEKREGTLGLLFLTPLTGMDIVVGKMVCHGLQMAYGVCAVFPVFFMPMFTGGVTWAEVSRIVLALGLALLMSSSVGMLVSVLGTESRRTMMAAFASVVLITALPMLYLLFRRLFFPLFPQLPVLLSPMFTVIAGFDSSYRTADGPFWYWGSIVTVFVLSLALVFLSGLLIGHIFKDLGRGKEPKEPNSRSSSRTRVRDGNPYEWAVLRNGRDAYALGVLVYFAIIFFGVMLLTSLLTRHWQEGFVTAFFTALAVHWISKLRLAVEATRQINNDRQSGALELLLVTPLPEQSIVNGHRSALRKLSLKTLVVLIGLNLILELCVLLAPGQLHMDREDKLLFTNFFAGGMALAVTDFSALRWRAFLKGLQARTHVRAAIVTFSSVIVLPWVGLGLAVALASGAHSRTPMVFVTFLTWILSCLLYDWLMIQRCRWQLRTGLRRLASEGS